MTELVRWRETRDPRIGKAIVEAPAETADAFAAIDALPAKQQTAALTAALAKFEDVGALARAIDRFARTRRFAWPVIEQLADLDPDPRWAWLALTLLADFERLPPKSAKLWRRLVDAVEQHGDAAFGAALAGVVPAKASNPLKTRIGNVGARLAKRTTVAVDDATRAIWQGALAARPRPEVKPPDLDAEALLAAVYADPDDLGARGVYGDWLVAHADPRGEFIQLQLQRTAGTLTAAGARREKALLRKHARAWLEPLTRRLSDGFGDGSPPDPVPASELAVPVDRLRHTTFANGFVAQLQPTIVDDAPMLATVTRALGLRRCAPGMRALREAVVDDLASLRRLPRPLARLGIDWLGDLDVAPMLGIPTLDVGVDSGGVTDWGRLLADNPRLVKLIVRWGLEHAWGRVLAPAALAGAPGLREVVLTSGSRRLTLRRRDATTWYELACDRGFLAYTGFVPPAELRDLGPIERAVVTGVDVRLGDVIRECLAPFVREVVLA